MLRPAASVELDEAGASRLVVDAFPDLAPARARALGSGWDNHAFLIEGEWVFRFPRRPEVLPWLDAEIRVAPVLAPLVPLAISAPDRVAGPRLDYPYPFAGYRCLAGVTACSAGLDDGARAALAEPLGRFLRALHGAEPAIEGPVPVDELGKSDLARAVERIRAHLDAIPRGIVDAARVLALTGELARAAPMTAPKRWVHGDLYPRHLVIRDGAIAGVIDWSDVHRGDPALDLNLVFGWIPAPAHGRFFDAYGPVDASTRDRAKMRALTYGLVFVRHGLDTDDAIFTTMGRTYLAQLLR